MSATNSGKWWQVHKMLSDIMYILTTHVNRTEMFLLIAGLSLDDLYYIIEQSVIGFCQPFFVVCAVINLYHTPAEIAQHKRGFGPKNQESKHVIILYIHMSICVQSKGTIFRGEWQKMRNTLS